MRKILLIMGIFLLSSSIYSIAPYSLTGNIPNNNRDFIKFYKDFYSQLDRTNATLYFGINSFWDYYRYGAPVAVSGFGVYPAQLGVVYYWEPIRRGNKNVGIIISGNGSSSSMCATDSVGISDSVETLFAVRISEDDLMYIINPV